jgi:PAP2 superfamily
MLGWRWLDRASGISWLQALFPPLWSICTTFALGLSASALPVTLDRYLYAADGGFGFQPAFAGARLLLANPWLLHTCAVCYFNLPVGMTLVYLALRKEGAAEAKRFVRFAVWLGIAGFALYFLCPAVGPGWAFAGDFPYRTPKAAMIPVTMGTAARNCMPSLHTAWILCLVWSRPALSRWWRAALWAFSGFTLLYALSAGGHYLVDLIVAAPFTRAVRTALDGRWRSPMLLHNAAMVGLWLVLLRFGTPLLTGSRLVLYALAAGTLLGAVPRMWLRLPQRPGSHTALESAGTHLKRATVSPSD